MNWLEVFETVGTSAVLAGALSYLAKVLMNSLLSKDLEKFKAELSAKNSEMIERVKAELSAKNAEALEPLKAELQQATQKISVQFSSLHSKRLEVMAEAYEHVVTLSALCMDLSLELLKRDHRKTVYATSKTLAAEPWEMKEGIHTFNENEKLKLTELNSQCTKLMKFFSPKEIYFSTDLGWQINSFVAKAASLNDEYENMAFEDVTNEEAYLDFHKRWVELNTGVLELKLEIGSEFRELLGVKDKDTVFL